MSSATWGTDEVLTVRECVGVIQLCDQVVQAQDEQIRFLEQEVQKAHEQLEKSESKSTIPAWVWFAAGVAGGAAIGYTIAK